MNKYKRHVGKKAVRSPQASRPLKQLCADFCAYYKPGKPEDLSCMGYTVVERLIKKGRQIPMEKTAVPVDEGSAQKLSETICHVCPFREDGCDFAAGTKGSAPCGGFLLLCLLVGGGILDIDDIRDIV